MLEDELARKDAEMDTQLVEELILTLEPDGPDAATLERTWERIASELPAAQRKRQIIRVLDWLKKAAAYLLLALVLLLAVYAVAKVFRVDLLRMWFETALTEERAQGSACSEALHTTAAEEFPDTYNGYQVVPSWMPDRFAFEQGMLYEDESMVKLSVIYSSSRGDCTITTITCCDGVAIPQCAYEKQPNADAVWCIDGYLIDCYTNADDEVLSATWIMADAQYSIYGDVSGAEMNRIIASIIE